MRLEDYKLHVLPGREKYIPRGILSIDTNYFDWDSLCRLYGEREVEEYLKRAYGDDWMRMRDALRGYG